MNKYILFFISISVLLSAEIKYTKQIIDRYTNAHILVVDPNEFEISSKRAQEEKGIYRNTLLSFVASSNAIAAINGGFWKGNGDPAGILKCDGAFIGLPVKPRGAIGWKDGGKVVFVDQLLTEKKNDLIYVYPQSGYTVKENWQDLTHIVGGALILIRNGEVVSDHKSEQTIESFRLNKHARTAVGIRKNGEWVFVVIDQCQKWSGGMTITELSNFMFDLELVDGVNLDGGSSSKMVIGGQIMTQSPLDRPVSDAICIFKK